LNGRKAVIRSIGMSVPDRILTNDELAKMVDTNDEWIRQRTGIAERRVCAEDESCSTLATRAARAALQRSGLDPMDLDLIIVGTVTGDMLFPATACLVQENIGAKRAAAFDVGAACAGFIYSVSVAASMIENGQVNRALVVGVDVLSKFTDWTDRSTCVLFGDGAGAVVLEGKEGTDRGVLKTVLLADGSGAPHINMEVGGSLHPACHPKSKDYRASIFMAGAEVYRFAVHAMGDACCKVLELANMDPTDVDLFVPHQANIRIIQSAAERLKLPEEKVFINVQKYGNTSGGSIPIGLYEAEKSGRLQEGMVVLTVGFGAGLVWGANLIRW